MKYQELTEKFLPYNNDAVDEVFRAELTKNKKKIVVLDDDPTGTQTVHGVNVFTDWSEESFREGFSEDSPLFFILTNSRAFDRETTERVHREIAKSILAQGKDFILISRGDSTLRGHFPLETACMNDEFTKSGTPMDGEIILPFFPEGGRYTVDDIHYVRYLDDMVPAGETEFARDKTFGYKSSNLREWIEEKTAGSFKAGDVISIGIDDLRTMNYEKITATLCGCSNFQKVIVNALEYDDLKVFATAFYRASEKEKKFMFRSAAGIVKILGGVSEKPLLTSNELRDGNNTNGGLVIAGSHVAKTTAQLAALRENASVVFVELNQHLAMDSLAFDNEAKRVSKAVNEMLAAGKNTVVMTRRERFDLGIGKKEDELKLAVTIGDRLTEIVSGLNLRPSFIIAKGGITSSDVAAKGLGIRKARVAGQILPGVPVWKTGSESKFKDLMLVIFPGNVGDENALLQAVEKFEGRKDC